MRVSQRDVWMRNAVELWSTGRRSKRTRNPTVNGIFARPGLIAAEDANSELVPQDPCPAATRTVLLLMSIKSQHGTS